MSFSIGNVKSNLFIFLRTWWPAVLVSVSLLVITHIVYTTIIAVNNSVFVYALDDAYIHMAMAKNVVEHGVWGVTQHGFTSSSSSLLWVILLSIGYWLAGVNDYLPLILNMIFGVGIFFVGQLILQYWIKNKTVIFVVLASLIILVPFPVQIISGMEHMMHTFFSLLFLYLFLRWKAAKAINQTNWLVWLCITAVFMVASRYEGGFFVFGVCMVMLFNKKIVETVIVAVSGLIPMVAYGLYSLQQGWYFLPNSLLVKTDVGAVTNIISEFLGLLIQVNVRTFEKQLTFSLFFIVGLFLLSRRFKPFNIDESKMKDLRSLTIVTLVGITLHMLLARIGWLFRYEAYLLTVGLLIIGVFCYGYLYRSIVEKRSYRELVAVLIGLFMHLLLFIPRVQVAHYATTVASKNIFDQYHTLSEFVHRYYNSESIAATDVGMISYRTDIKLVDLLGLADREIGTEMMRATYSIDDVFERVSNEDVAIAFVFDEFEERVSQGQQRLDDEWTLVGVWDMGSENLLVRISFKIYAMDEDVLPTLKKNLIEFNTQYLPHDIDPVVY